ncbi:MAG: thioredoxin domain-containing protein [Planctomycetes bacterium]|nr:thioredoxin domain-containing protein [Planctomycetota bacterium]
MSSSPKKHAPNRLAQETSPYLLQHAHNPVDWYPWGPEALQRARDEDKPIFLSVGYSACHWCHVMERESFEDPAIAELMNAGFVNVKVDREERPDVDEIYMKAVQAMTGSGGWPMSVFLTPDLQPFYGGTYFPPRGLYGRPGFAEVLNALTKAWQDDRARLVQRAGVLTKHISDEARFQGEAEIDPAVLDASLDALAQSFDPLWGGFGSAPKFPHAVDLSLCLRHWKRTGDEKALAIATTSLDRMAEGGVFDQLGGGFHRYSVDERWLIPHFEKMLYDNALLVPAYLDAFVATRSERYARVARECCDWVLREMTTKEGGFASSQDADSEGHEGKFFAWTPRELESVLGAKLGAWAAAWFGVTVEGNFENGTSALWRHEKPAVVASKLGVKLDELERAMQTARTQLFEARETRVHPGLDDKVLASWNGLMIRALARAAQVLDEPRYLRAAQDAARYVTQGMRRENGRLFATARHGRAHLEAYLDDYAFVIEGLIDLYETDFDKRWIETAVALDAVVRDHFEDPDNGGCFTTADDHEKLLARLKAPHDGALPSGNSVHAGNLLRLAEFTGRRDLAERAEKTIRSVGALANRYPAAFSSLLLSVDWLAVGPREIVVGGERDAPRTQEFLRAIRSTFTPQRVVALADSKGDSKLMPLLEGKVAGAGAERVWVCRNYACQAPVDDAGALEAEIRG